MSSTFYNLLVEQCQTEFGDPVDLFYRESQCEYPGKIWDLAWILQHTIVIEKFFGRWLAVLQSSGYLWNPDALFAKRMTALQRILVSQLQNVPGAELFFGKDCVTYYGPDQDGARVVMHIPFSDSGSNRIATPDTLILDLLESWKFNTDRNRAHEARRELCEAILSALGVEEFASA